jgi:hypothetical protein
VNHLNDEGIWVGSGGSLNLVAREGDVAPGTEGETFFQIDQPSFNNDGHVLFESDLVHPTGGVSGVGIWSDRSGTLSLVSRSGDPAPGIPGEAYFAGSYLYHSMNDHNRIAFSTVTWDDDGGITSENDGGIWSDVGGSLQLVAREGDHAPGTPVGAVFDQVIAPFVNNSGEVAFVGSLRQGLGGITDANDFGYWVQDASGELRLVVREGDAIEVAPGDERTIASVSSYLNASNDGRIRGFNDLGQIAFSATFTDGSQGVFVSAPTDAGDYNRDGAIDAADYVMWRKTQGQSVAAWQGADGSGNGKVDAADHSTWVTTFGYSMPSELATGNGVPEPGGIALAMFVAVTALSRRAPSATAGRGIMRGDSPLLWR